MKKFLTSAILAATASLGSAEPATAGLDYAFRFDQAEYVVDPGNTVEAILYLRERVTGQDTTQIGPSGPGLLGIGALVSAPGTDVGITGHSIGPAFDTDFTKQPENPLLLYAATTGTAFADDLGGSFYEIEAGRITFRGVTPGAVSNVSAANPDNDPLTAFTVLFDQNSTVLDDLILPAGAVVRVTGAGAIPEPSSLVCLSLLASLACGTVLWRRQAVRA